MGQETKGLAKDAAGYAVQAVTLGKGSGQTANGDVDVAAYTVIEFGADTVVTVKFTDGTTAVTVSVKEGSRYGISDDVNKLSFTGTYNIC